MSLALSGADAGHLVVAVGLTYALGFERAIRGAPAGDRVFALIGAAAGQGRLLVAAVATVLTAFVLEIRHIRVLNVLDGRRWASRFRDDEAPPGGFRTSADAGHSGGSGPDSGGSGPDSA